MSRRVLALSSVVWPLALVTVFVACTGLKRADGPADAGGAEAGDERPVDDEGGPGTDGGDAASIDAGPPPTDFECSSDEWVKTTKTKAECAPRQVIIVEPLAPIDVSGVAIARTPFGRVGIVYNSETSADSGEMHFAHFTPAKPGFAAPKIIKRASLPFSHDGYVTKIAASAPDTLALLTYDMDDSRTGEIHLRKLAGGADPLTDDLMATGVNSPTEIAIASDGSGNLFTAARIALTATTAKLSTWQKSPAGAFTKLPDITSSLQFTVAAGVGATSLFVDPGGQAHLLYQWNDNDVAPAHSTPRYHTLAGGIWSDRKTVDNNIIAGLAGFNPRIVVFGTKKFAVFYFRKAQSSPPRTADLRLATWDSSMDVPQIEILDQQIPSDDELSPGYRVALVVDKFGLLHIATIRPATSNSGYVEYRRQVRTANGSIKWLSDIVDKDVVAQVSQAHVDLVVDENARPHIAYLSAKDGKVRYATRFDR